MPNTAPSEQPRINISQSSRAERHTDGLWRVSFRIENASEAPIVLLAAWLPHGRFRCEEQPLGGMPPMPPGGEAQLTFPVAFNEEPGTAVENTFVILRLTWRDGTWRVLVRFTVTALEDGAPDARTELITVHPIGFAP